MKTLIILVLVLALVGALFFTRPSKADFEQFVRQELFTADGKPTGGGKTVTDKLREQFRTFVEAQGREYAADRFLERCTYDNNWLWINVEKDSKVIYTGALNHWFERDGGAEGGTAAAGNQ